MNLSEGVCMNWIYFWWVLLLLYFSSEVYCRYTESYTLIKRNVDYKFKQPVTLLCYVTVTVDIIFTGCRFFYVITCRSWEVKRYTPWNIYKWSFVLSVDKWMCLLKLNMYLVYLKGLIRMLPRSWRRSTWSYCFLLFSTNLMKTCHFIYHVSSLYSFCIITECVVAIGWFYYVPEYNYEGYPTWTAYHCKNTGYFTFLPLSLAKWLIEKRK